MSKIQHGMRDWPRPSSGHGHAAHRPAAKSAPAPKVKDHGRETIRAATYNVAGGNKNFGPNFESHTSDRVAQQMRQGVGVMSLQEVAVGTKNAGNLDYNREILKDVFAQSHHLQADEVQAYYVDAHGEHPITDEASQKKALKADHWVYEGGGHSMEVGTESLNSNGLPVTVYRAQMDDGKEYNSVFVDSSSSHNRGKYGNAVLLGPEMNIRDQNGRVIPENIEARQLGADPAPWKTDDNQREKRTALGVRFTTPGDQTVTAFSAHLTTASINDDRAQRLVDDGHPPELVEKWRQKMPQLSQQERQHQAHALEVFSHEFGGDRNVLVGGDFNQRDLSQIGAGGESGRLRETNPVYGDFDHQLFSPDITTDNQHWVRGGHGDYSDHDLLRIDVTV